MNIRYTTIASLLLATGLLAGGAQAALPKPTPAQQQAAADKKAKADAQAAKDKESLAASMDGVAAHWRSRAAQQGWKTHPPVAIAAAPPAAAAPGAAVPAVTGAVAASAAPVTGAAPAGQPAGQLTPTGAAAPIKSEKLGTAAPSTDVKKAPTQAQPRDAKPTVDKGTPDVKNK